MIVLFAIVVTPRRVVVLVTDVPVPVPVIVVAGGRCLQSCDVITKSPGTRSTVVSPPVAPAGAGRSRSAMTAAVAGASRFNWNTPSGWVVSRGRPASGGARGPRGPRRGRSQKVLATRPSGYHPPATLTAPSVSCNAPLGARIVELPSR